MSTQKKPDPTIVELLQTLAPAVQADKATADAFADLRNRLLKDGAAEVTETAINAKFDPTYDFTIEHRTGREIETFIDFFDDAVARVGLALDKARSLLNESERVYLRGKVEDMLTGSFNGEKCTVHLPTLRQLAEQASLTQVVLLSQKVLEVGKPKDQERRNMQRKMLRDKVRLLKADIDGRSDSVMHEERDFQERLAAERAEQVAFLEAIEAGDTVETNGAEGDAALLLAKEQFRDAIAHIDEQAARGCGTRAHIATQQAEVDRLVRLLEVLNEMDLRSGDESLPDGFLEDGYSFEAPGRKLPGDRLAGGLMESLAELEKVKARMEATLGEAEQIEAERNRALTEAEKAVLGALWQTDPNGDHKATLQKLLRLSGVENITV